MGLKEYRSKRRFDVTAEPAGARRKSASGNLYVIQKHAASRLHYDFRLELDGVLKSWAVPKGPSLDPAQKMLAVQVEDHPIEYGSFEGIIPQGQYGGGTVLLWDRGHWRAIGDAEETYRKGKLKFELHGQKLKGIWNLVRMGGARAEKKREWLLIKHPDEFARPASEYSIIAAEPRSVESGRDLDEIAGASPEVWQSRPAATKKGLRPSRRQKFQFDPATLPDAKRAEQPEFITPQLATAVKTVPDGDEWLHEIKLDGYRILSVLRDGRVHLYTRRNNDWTETFPEVARAVEALPVRNAIIDGEVVALDEKGASDFQALQNVLKTTSRGNLVYFAFDLLHCDGFDLTKVPLAERKRLLASLIAISADKHRLRFSNHIVGQGPDVLREACRIGLEGVVSKRPDKPYFSGRNTYWLKAKCKSGQEFVIGGFTDPSGTRIGFGALLLGYYDPEGKLRYSGRVGTGFDDASLAELHDKLRKLEIPKSPFADLSKGRGHHWVRPELVAEVEYTQITRDGLIRHPSFKGLRKDKKAREVVLEELGEPPAPHTPSKKASAAKKSSAVSHKPSAKSVPPVHEGRPKGGSKGPSTVAGVRLTNPERVLYPDVGLTKTQLAEYYESVAKLMLPHVADRPLMIVRCPTGVAGQCFYQKHLTDSFPDSLRGVKVREKEGDRVELVLDDVRGLVSLAQISVLEVHTWGSRADSVEKPDRLIFDLDPAPDVAWKAVVDAARQLHGLLGELKLESFVKLSGGKGLHVIVPIDRRHTWEQAENFTRSIATAFATASPTQYIATMSKAKRHGKIFIDYLRNQRGSTCVAPYSTRARPGAAISAPVGWKELSQFKSAEDLKLPDMAGRLSRVGDVWKGFADVRQRIPAKFG